MTVYRDAAHCIARIMSIETNTCIAQSAWQRRYQAGLPELNGDCSGLSAEDRLAQDAMTRRRIEYMIPPAQWHALVAKYSINELEVRESVRWLIARIETPAHHLFKMKSVMAWAVPKRSRRLPEKFYLLHSWDADGTPESTLRRWRGITNRWLEDQVTAAHRSVGLVLEMQGLLIGQPDQQSACIS
jgi:hypothetical protein